MKIYSCRGLLVLLLLISATFSAPAQESPMAPPLFVNQIGYLPHAAKIAYVSAALGLPFHLLEEKTQTPVLKGMLLLQEADHPASGMQVWKADFSAIATPGEYWLEVPGLGRSYTFAIRENLYQELTRNVMEAFRSFRMPAKAKPSVQIWGASQAAQAAGESVDAITGGWCDGSDVGRYAVSGIAAAGMLLTLHEALPAAFGDGTLPNHAPNNGISDLLDTVRWELDWLRQMQHAEGGLHHKLTPTEPNLENPEEQLKATHFLFPVSTAATAAGCALFAKASRLYAPVDATFSAECLEASLRSWEFLETHENDKGFHNPPEVRTKPYSDPDDTDERFWAAVELYLVTGEPSFLQSARIIAERRIPLLSASGYWGNAMPLAAAACIRAMTQAGDAELVQEIRTDLLSLADSLLQKIDRNGFSLSLKEGEFTWGSNGAVLQNAFILLLAAEVGDGSDYRSAAMHQLHYLLGRNPLSLCFVTGMGKRSPKHPFNPLLFQKEKLGLIPGLLVGGANQSLNDGILKKHFPADYPPALIYRDEAESFSSNEISLTWNAALAYVSAMLAFP